MRLQTNTLNFFKLNSVYLNFKISIKITVANLLNHKKANYIFIEKRQLIYLRDNAFINQQIKLK